MLFLVLNFFAATQDIGVDGLAVDILRKDEMGPGNSAQLAGFKVGNLFGGGVLLALSGWLGWSGDFLIMGACILGAMLFLLATDENALGQHEPKEKGEGPGMTRELIDAFRSRGPWLWVFLLFAKFGETYGGAMVKPMLVDHGFSRETIGLLDGVFGSISTILGAILGGLACRRFGWRRTLAVFSCLQGAFLVVIGTYSLFEITPLVAGALNAVENFAGGGVGVSIFALAMGLCSKEVGATQFTACQVCYMSGGALAYPLAGRVADAAGYLPVMAAGGIMAILVALLALRFGKRFECDEPVGAG